MLSSTESRTAQSTAKEGERVLKIKMNDNETTPLRRPPAILLEAGLSDEEEEESEEELAARTMPKDNFIIHITAPNRYVDQRRGGLLGRDMVLKSDHFPTESNSQLIMNISGGPNFRQVSQTPIYGVGQPSVYATRTILNLLGSKKNRRILWISLREEPLVYLNSRSFVLRDMLYPFQNLSDFQDMPPYRIQRLEQLLKKEILSEADNNYGNILVHDEMELGQLRACWEAVDKSTLQTSTEVFQTLTHEGFKVDFLRLPITAESPFDPKDFDSILAAVTKLQPGESAFPPVVINCQMGRGRSTMGTIILYLLFQSLYLTSSTHAVTSIASFFRSPKVATRQASTNTEGERDDLHRFRKGNYDSVYKLVRILGMHGRTAKAHVDVAIDTCGAVHHVRQTLLSSFVKAQENDDGHRENATKQPAMLLQRYFYLICFAAYLEDLKAKNTPIRLRSGEEDAAPSLTFERWIKQQPELLNFVLWVAKQSPDVLFSPVAMKAKDHFELFVLKRKGAILNSGSILKSEHFKTPPQRIQKHKGLPNFRTLPDIPYSATGQPTLLGIRKLLTHLGSASVVAPKDSPGIIQQYQQEVSVINLREEPVIFIQGEPYLLREQSHPLRALAELRQGVTKEKIAQLESLIKADILEELKTGNGILLTHVEETGHEIRPLFIKASPEDILTTEEVFEAMQAEGFRMRYHRVPLHVEESTGPQSLETLSRAINSQNKDTHIVFICQRGLRRSTIGLVVACLLRMHSGRLDFVFGPKTKVGTMVQSLEAASGSQGQVQLQLPRTTSQKNMLAALSEAASGDTGEMEETAEIELADNDEIHSEEAHYGRGQHKGIMNLIRILPLGQVVKEEVDVVIDFCSEVYNVRDAVLKEMRELETERSGKDHLHNLQRPIRYLESYAFLIAFHAYLRACKKHRQTTAATTASSPTLSAISPHFTASSPTLSASFPYPTASSPTLSASSPHSPAAAAAPRPPPSPSSLSFPPDMPTFANWVKGRPELSLAFDNIRREPEFSLRLDELAANDHSQYSRVFEVRNGNVLGRGMILKSDYFKGCQNHKITQFLPGAINFRALQQFPVAGTGIPTAEAGTGIPTAEGITRILKFLFRAPADLHLSQPLIPCKHIGDASQSPSPLTPATGEVSVHIEPEEGKGEDEYYKHFECDAVAWINLREEPLLYVNCKPFVLRDHSKPFYNLEHTGIARERLEAMELSLKRDVLNEAKLFNNKILLHDEDDDGNMVVQWEPVDNETVLTPRELFMLIFKRLSNNLQQLDKGSFFSEEVTASGLKRRRLSSDASPGPERPFSAYYHRIPITDEQAPTPESVDRIITALEEAGPAKFITVMNCQMGRGRTSTGMVVSCLWNFHRKKGSLGEIALLLQNKTKDGLPGEAVLRKKTLARRFSKTSQGSLNENKDGQPGETDTKKKPHLTRRFSIPSQDDDVETERSLKAGWFKIIQSLVRLLDEGLQRKKEVDAIIDCCSDMQNLREVVYETQVLAQDALPRKRPAIIFKGKNFLIRYFYLIVVSAYLHGQAAEDFKQSFVDWLSLRPEIKNLEDDVRYPE
eukprot:g43622.t1